MNDKIAQAMTDELLEAAQADLAGVDGWGKLCNKAADVIDNLRAQLAEAQAALKTVMRNAELSKEPCAPDPESPAAIRNGKFAGLASIAAQGLGMVRGPSLTQHLVEAQGDNIAVRVCRSVAELPDRDSPEGWPEAMLVTHEELHAIVLGALGEDAARLGWLGNQFVTVRVPLRYGSKECFMCPPTDKDGEFIPWNIRAAIDAAKGGRNG